VNGVPGFVDLAEPALIPLAFDLLLHDLDKRVLIGTIEQLTLLIRGQREVDTSACHCGVGSFGRGGPQVCPTHGAFSGEIESVALGAVRRNTPLHGANFR
jgi:hypothetical protein